MKLEEWMKKNKIGPFEFSRKIKTNPASLYNWRTGKFKPNKFFKKIIQKETNGEVSLSDWEET